MLRDIAARFGYVPESELKDMERRNFDSIDLIAESDGKIMQLEGEITSLNERLKRARHEWTRHNKYVKQVNAVLRDLYKKHGVSQTMLELLSEQFKQLTQEELDAAPMPSINPIGPNFALYYPLTAAQVAARNNRNGQEGTRRVVDILKRDMHLQSGKEVITGLRIIGLQNRYGVTVRSQHMLYYIPAVKILITRGVNKSVVSEVVGVPWKRIADYLTGTCVYKMDRQVMNRIALWFDFNPRDFEEWCLFQHQAQLDEMNAKRQTKERKPKHQMNIEEGKENTDEEAIAINESADIY